MINTYELFLPTFLVLTTMAMSSNANVPLDNIMNEKVVRFVDPPLRIERESSSSDFYASKPTVADRETRDIEFSISSNKDPDLYCIGRANSLSGLEFPQDYLRKGVVRTCGNPVKANGSPVESILKKGAKIGKYAIPSASDSSLASNPWNSSHDSQDLTAPVIPQRYASEDVSTDDSLEIEESHNTLDRSSMITASNRGESNRDVFLRQFLKDSGKG